MKTDKRTQRQKFIDKARELQTDESLEAFQRTLTAIASSSLPSKAKKPPTKKR